MNAETFDNNSDEILKKNGEPRKRFYRKLIGKMYGKLEIIAEAGYRGRNKLWEAKCHVCGKIKVVTGSQLRPYTKSCGCRRTMREWTSPYWKGVGEISRQILSGIQGNAKRRKISYDLTDEYLWNLFIEQERKCVLSGVDIKFGSPFRKEVTASLDRIDSSKGYIVGNVQWTHKDINIMKSNHTDKEFIELCKLVVNHNCK